MIVSVNGFIIFCLIISSAYFVGLLTFFAENEEDKCDMTYMFELPQYVRISNNFDRNFPKYRLYYYDEGPPHETTPKFFGIPVLFIPGNAGSHKQARSLASVALRRSINKRLIYHFDYFTIDMSEELTGLSGIFLKEQLDYVNKSLHFILTLYKHQKHAPTSVILIGHSMGGVIARKLAQMTNSPVKIVITLASPHKRSPIILDNYMSAFYENVKDPIRSDITFLSLSGGYNDLLVPTTLTGTKDNTSLYVVTTHIPLSWAPADHKQVLWCKQTVLVLTRCLFDCIDSRTRQISDLTSYRRQIFEHHLLKHSGTNAKFKEKYLDQTSIDENGVWIEKVPRQYSVRFLKGTKELQWYMVRLIADPKHEFLTVVALNMKSVDWVFACKANIPKSTYKICKDGVHLTQNSTIEPSARYKRRSVTLNLHELQKNDLTHVLLKIAPTQEPIVLHVDVYNSKERTLNFKLPTWYDVTRKIIVKETATNSIRYNVFLPDLTHVIQSFYVYLIPVKCSKEAHHATVSLIAPWGNEDSHKHFTDVDGDPFHLRLYDSKPNVTEKHAFLRLTLDPTCTYEISIQRSLKGTLSQLARFYTPLLIVNVATVVLLVLKTQLQSLGDENGCASFFTALKSGTKPYYVLGSAKLGTVLLSSSVFSKFLPVSNWYVLKEEGIDFFLLPYLMYLISVGVIWIFASLITVWITFCESAIHKFFIKFFNRAVPFTFIWSDYVMSVLQKVPFLVSVVIIFISYTTCGGLALALGTIFYFLKLTQMSQDYIEETVFTYAKKFALKIKKMLSGRSGSGKKDELNTKCLNVDEQKENGTKMNEQTIEETEKGDKKDRSEISTSQCAISFHGCMFLIWVIATVINCPSTITWARNYDYSQALRPDPSFVPGFLLSISTLPLWLLEMPNTRKKWYREVSYFINTVAAIGLIYAPIYIFRMNYLLPAVVLVVVAHQILAPVSNDDNSTQASQDDKIRDKYDEMKKKIE